MPAANYDLAVEIIRCRRLIKGYSDTHARGLVEVRPGAGGDSARRHAAPMPPTGAAACARPPCKDEEGKALDGAIAHHRQLCLSRAAPGPAASSVGGSPLWTYLIPAAASFGSTVSRK